MDNVQNCDSYIKRIVTYIIFRNVTASPAAATLALVSV
jgi:hypothetical protein